MLLGRQTTTAADVGEWSPTSQIMHQPRCHLEEQGDGGWRGKSVKVGVKHKSKCLMTVNLTQINKG